MSATVDILVPTCDRLAAPAVTLTSWRTQTAGNFRPVVSDQAEKGNPLMSGEVQAAPGLLRFYGNVVERHKHLPRCGPVEQRQFLLDEPTAPYTLFLDDDVILESVAVERLLTALQEEGCGFVGCSLLGLSYAGQLRPDEEIKFWEGLARPEAVGPGRGESRWIVTRSVGKRAAPLQAGD